MGHLIYEGKRDLSKEWRKNLSFAILISIPYAVLLVVIRNGPFLPSLYFLVISLPLGYGILISLMAGLYGVHNLRIYENGFILPNHTGLRRNISGDHLIPYQLIQSVYVNTYQNSHSQQKYITIIMKIQKHSCIINVTYLNRRSMLISYLSDRVIVYDLDYFIPRIGSPQVLYSGKYSLSMTHDEVRIKKNGHSEIIQYSEINKIGYGGKWILSVKGKREKIGFIDLPIMTGKELHANHKKYRSSS